MQATLQTVAASGHRFWGTGFPLFDQVGVGDQGASQCHQVCQIVIENAGCTIRAAHATGSDQGQIGLGPYPGQGVHLGLFRQPGMVEIPWRTEAGGPHAHMNGVDAGVAGHFQQWRQIFRTNSEFRRHFVSRYAQDPGQARGACLDRRKNLADEQQPVLAIAVRAMVYFTVEELGHQVAVAALNFDGVETGTHCFFQPPIDIRPQWRRSPFRSVLPTMHRWSDR